MPRRCDPRTGRPRRYPSDRTLPGVPRPVCKFYNVRDGRRMLDRERRLAREASLYRARVDPDVERIRGRESMRRTRARRKLARAARLALEARQLADALAVATAAGVAVEPTPIPRGSRATRAGDSISTVGPIPSSKDSSPVLLDAAPAGGAVDSGAGGVSGSGGAG